MPTVARSVHLPQQRRRRADTVAPPLRQAVYGVEHKARRLRAAQQAEAEAAAAAAPPQSAPQFVMMLLHPQNGFPAFGALHAATEGGA